MSKNDYNQNEKQNQENKANNSNNEKHKTKPGMVAHVQQPEEQQLLSEFIKGAAQKCAASFM